MIPPKRNIFHTPEGYFEKLPEVILEKSQRKQQSARQAYWYGAAAAAVVFGLVLSVLRQQAPETQVDLEANLQPEIEMYISSDHWQAEDILTLTDDPDGLLEEIIITEWGSDVAPAEEQEDGWF
jgi:hypothetical protein